MRLLIGITALAMALALVACGGAGNVAPVTADDMSLGNPQAKVTVIEYASVACPICAQWNNDNWAAFKKKYIDTGRVHYVLREALTHDASLAAAGFALARCAGKDKYFDVVDALFHKRDAIEASAQPRAILSSIAQTNGLSEAQFEACESDPKLLSSIQTRWNRYIEEDHIEGTPTFVINGKSIDDYVPMSQMDELIANAEEAPAH